MRSNQVDGYMTREQVESLLAETREEISPLPGLRRHRKNSTRLQQTLHVLVNFLYTTIMLLLLVVLFVGVQAKLQDRQAYILGYSIYTVETGSMVPTLPIGCYIVTRVPDDPAGLSIGTVITFHTTQRSTYTHRIIEVLYEDGVKYRTKGDNPQNSPDPELVTPDRVLGTLQFSVSLPKIWQGQ